MSDMFMINTSDATSTLEFTLSEPIDGEYELVHQWMEDHTPAAIDGTCDELIVTIDGGLEVTYDLPNQTTLDKAALATSLDTDLGADVTVDISSGNLRFTTASGTTAEIKWKTSSARILFYKTAENTSIESAGSASFEFRDRSFIKHYTCDIEEAYYRVATSSGRTPTLLLSSADSDVVSQKVFIPSSTSTLNLSFREYGALENLSNADVPEMHLVFKKV